MRILSIAALAACTAVASAADVLLIGDPSAGAIYERGLDEGAGPARLVSGRIGFLSNYITIGNDRFAFYLVGAKVVEFDRTARTLAEIDSVPAGVGIFGISALPDANHVSYATVQSGDLKIVSGSRTGPGAPWTFADAGFSLSPSAGTPQVLDFLQIDESHWAVVVADPSPMVLLASLGDVANPLQLSGLSDSRLDRGPDGKWVVLSSRGIGDTRIHDLDGNLLKSIPAASGTVFDGRATAIDWNPGAAGTDVVTFTGINRADDPLDSTPIASLLHSFLGALGHDPNLDLGDANEIRRRTVGGWQVAREGVGILADVDGPSGATATAIVVNAGTGPAIANIVDMVEGDGKIWALCGYSLPQVVMLVDRATANRELFAIIQDDFLFETIARADDGTIFLAGRQYRIAGPGESAHWQTVRKIVAVDGSQVATLETVAEGLGDGTQFALALDAAGDPIIAAAPVDGPVAWRADGTALEGAGSIELAGTIPVQTNPVGSIRATTQVQWPVSGAPESIETALVLFHGTSSSGIPQAARLVLPDATTIAVAGGPLGRHVDFSTDPDTIVLSAPFPMAGVAPQAGTWTVELDFPGSAITPTWTGAELRTRAVGSLAAATIRQDGSLLAVCRNPARLVSVGLDDASTAELPLSVGDGVLFSDELDRLREIAIDPATGNVFAALRDTPRIIRIDPATGAAVEFVSGRPDGIDTELLDLAGDTQFSLAIAPAVEPVSAVETFELY